jgi:hypothetical protein
MRWEGGDRWAGGVVREEEGGSFGDFVGEEEGEEIDFVGEEGDFLGDVVGVGSGVTGWMMGVSGGIGWGLEWEFGALLGYAG